MNGRYERVVLDLEPWLRGLLRRKEVAGHLKALGDDGQGEGGGEDLAEGVAADARGEVMAKALGVAHDIESGRLPAPNEPPEQYFKEVMRNALVDWFRTHPKALGLSPDKRAEIDNGLFSIDKDEGDEGFGAWPTTRAPDGSHPPDPRASARPRRPFLLTLMRPPRSPNPAEYAQVLELLNAIPNESRREVVFLNLQGYRQEQIAAKVFRTQQAVSKALQEQHAVWGWDDEQVQRIQYLVAYRNLVRLFGRVFPPRGRESLDFKEEGFDSGEDRVGAQKRWAEERYRTHERSFELPQEEEAYRRSLPLKSVLGDQWGKPDRQQGSKERRQEKLNRLKAQEAMLYQAIMNEPALARWRKGLKLYHMQQLIAWMARDDGWDYDDDDGWLRL